jgi:hypothetical protein
MQAETSNRSSTGEPKDEAVPLQAGVTWSYGLGLAFYIAYLEPPHKRALPSKTTAAMLRTREFGILGGSYFYYQHILQPPHQENSATLPTCELQPGVSGNGEV